jgi:site-specific DNA-cytosine methylase
VALSAQIPLFRWTPATSREFKVLHVFAGIGGFALGFQEAQGEYKGLSGSFRTLAGIDVDPDACEDFQRITGSKAVEMDLFSREDYTAFWGHEPPEDWREATAEDIRKATEGEYPDVIALSPPCKGFSSLLPQSRAESPKYQALNRLVIRGLALVMEAFADDPPSVVLIENVPRITTRGAALLEQVKRMLGFMGYVFNEDYHDCGEIGGLGQRRKRYLLIARNEAKMGASVYQAPLRRVRSIGEILGPLPLPDDPSAGPLHRTPKLEWDIWVRLALIPAGKDWRALDELARDQDWFKHAYRIVPWDQCAGTVTSGHSPSCGAVSVADPRLPERDNRHPNIYRVSDWNAPSQCVTGTRFGSGAPAIADPRLGYRPRRGVYKVEKWDKPCGTVVGSARVNGSNGTAAIADPRVRCRPRNGTYKVQRWDHPPATVTAAGDIHAGTSAVADPRGQNRDCDLPPVIIALDGTWHRPLTTLELAALQGFPVFLPDGSPLTLAGNSSARWRERIGNAVPPPAAKAIAVQILSALLVSARGEWVLGNTPVWVRPRPWQPTIASFAVQ